MTDRSPAAALDLGRFGESLVRGAPDAIVYADEAGVIRFWNAGAERIFGFSTAEAVGRSLDIIIPERLRARHWEGYERVMSTGASRYGAGDVLAVPGVRKDGSRISLEFTVVPFRDAEGRMRGIAAILRDVTKRFDEIKELRRRLAANEPGR
jgi:PAS domain S-box-containing protein